MPNIHVLDQNTINKIAAGEVIERPASVVKELLENAIDAKATAVTVEIREGGISFIRVTDNGCGIEKEEIPLAFLRHSTSKIQSVEDLFTVSSLGFRGEALSSIAAVGQVELITKTSRSLTGNRYQIEGGQERGMEEIGAPDGTTFIVRNLFYNVPARRKFLKKPATESGYVSDLVNKIALGHPEVAIHYINNGNTVLHTAGNNDPKTAVFYVYGKDAANSMLPISYRKGEYAVSGLIGKPEFCRANRNYENLFINGRFIKNPVVSAAVEDAYKTKLLIGKFPVFVLNLAVEPAQVDVNVHPAKLEVRFKNDDEVYEFFYNAVAKALQETVLIPKAVLEKKPKERLPQAEQQTLADMPKKAEQPKEPMIKENIIKESVIKAEPTANPSVNPSKEIPLPQSQGVLLSKEEREKLLRAAQQPQPPTSGECSVDELLKRTPKAEGFAQTAVPYRREDPKPKEEQPIELKPIVSDEKTEEAKQPFFQNYKIIGQVFRTYWIVEQGDCLYLIDQHAAHERVLYEEFMNKFKEERVASQRLLTPLMLQLTPMETDVLRRNLALLESFGFELEEFGEKYALRATPYLLQNPTEVGFFTDILDRLTEERISNVYDTKILAVATMACKAAVKGHDVLSTREAEELIHRLLGLEHPFTCPHGRPTIIELTKYEMEKMFKRIQN